MNVIKECRYGLVCYNTNDQWVGKSLTEYGEFSEGEASLFRDIIHPNDTIFDVGANIGTHTLAFARFTGPSGVVMAFEPQRLAYYMLCSNISLNNLTNVYCLQNAVSDESGRINVPELDYRKSNNFGGLALDQEYENAASTSVKVIKLDDYLSLPNIKFIKVDVEGMERQVLLGSKKLIEKHRPILYVENDRKEKASLLIQTLRRLGYTLYFHLPVLFNPNNYTGNTKNVFHNTVSVNLLCVPKEITCPVDQAKHVLQELSYDKKRIIITAPNEDQIRVLDDMHSVTTQNLLNIADMYSEVFFDPDKAMEALQTAFSLKPKDTRLLLHAIPILTRHLRYKEALECVEKVMKGGMTLETLMSRAIILGNLNRHEESAETYKAAININPDNVEAHFGLAIDLLTMGRYKEGFKLYEWRFKRKMQALSQFMSSLPKNVPFWQGEPLDNKIIQTILVFVEQGAGDLFQFVRFIPQIKKNNNRVLLACFPDTAKLMKNAPGVDQVVEYTEDLFLPQDIKYDTMISVLSLPHILELESIPHQPKYLEPFGDRLFPVTPVKFNIGIAWAGSETHPNDFTRSCHLKHFEHLVRPDVQLFSLQRGSMTRNWPNVGNIDLTKDANIPMTDWSDQFRDFNDTANLIRSLDLVISVDTSIIHLAAAMGKPTWLLTPPTSTGSCDWRWLVDREDSPWYPSLRIFRGPDWESIFKSVKKELHETLSNNSNKRSLRTS